MVFEVYKHYLDCLDALKFSLSSILSSINSILVI